MESAPVKMAIYLRTAASVLLAITKMKKTGSANVRFKSKKRIEGGTYTVLLSDCFTRLPERNVVLAILVMLVYIYNAVPECRSNKESSAFQGRVHL